MANKEPAKEAYTAEITKPLSLYRATSTPMVAAATSESCNARNARPVALYCRLSAITAPNNIIMALKAYQNCALLSLIPILPNQARKAKLGTSIPSGPPVNQLSLVKTMDTKIPNPNVATDK